MNIIITHEVEIMAPNTFGALDFLIEGQELTLDQRRLIYDFRGNIAAGNLNRDMWYVGEKGKVLTFPELFDGEGRYNMNWNKWRGDLVTPQIRQLLIGEYLLSGIEEMVDVADSSAGNAPRVVAELRRYGARLVGHSPKEIRVTPEIVGAYCKDYDIGQLEEPILIATGLKKPEGSGLGEVVSLLVANSLRPDFYNMGGIVHYSTAHR